VQRSPNNTVVYGILPAQQIQQWSFKRNAVPLCIPTIYQQNIGFFGSALLAGGRVT